MYIVACRILTSPDHFIAFVGLNKSPDESDATSSNRAQVSQNM